MLQGREVQVIDVMSDVVVTVTPADSLLAAWELLWRGGFHHLPVVGSDGRCLSLLDDRLVAGSLVATYGLTRRRVADIMPARVHCITAGSSLGEAAEIMHQDRATALPVVDERMHLIGIVTDSDVVAVVARMFRDALPAAPAS